MTKSVHDALAGIGFTRQVLADGAVIEHKFRPGVTGKIRISDGDYQVLWSDRGTRGGQWEKLHSGDVGRPARRQG